LREEMRWRRAGLTPLPAAFPTIAPGRSPGSWESGVSPSRELALTVAGPVGRWLIRPHALTVAGAAKALAGRKRPRPHLFPVSPWHRSRARTPRTSALIVQHKLPAAVRESTLKRNPYTLT
jgi:hypothetical protein